MSVYASGMDEILGQVLDVLPLLRAVGRDAEAHTLLRALTEGCNPREILGSLQVALAELPEGIEPEVDRRVSTLLGAVGRLCQEL
ncbi:MAG TPA: hypothetical protein VJ623_02100 [Holophagaceae bacterium]|nr:hypothetical protein [Holophagaceae bacterium]